MSAVMAFLNTVTSCIRSEHRPLSRGGVKMFEALIIVTCIGILYVEIIEILAKLDDFERLRRETVPEIRLDDRAAPSHQTH
jgi:hypothetical protein